MGHNLTSEILNTARRRMQTQGQFSKRLILDVVDEVIDEFMRDGLITDDEDTESLKIEVKERLEEELK